VGDDVDLEIETNIFLSLFFHRLAGHDSSVVNQNSDRANLQKFMEILSVISLGYAIGCACM